MLFVVVKFVIVLLKFSGLVLVVMFMFELVLLMLNCSVVMVVLLIWVLVRKFVGVVSLK